MTQLLMVSAGVPSKSPTYFTLYMPLTLLPQARLGVFSHRGSGARIRKFSSARKSRDVFAFS